MCIRDSSYPELCTNRPGSAPPAAVSYTHLRAHETTLHLVCRLLLEKTSELFYHFLPIVKL
ncbi:hypothetical protein, partial [Staphylococcus aureus]